MGIFSRTRDIVAANMAELLDRSDDPAKMIRLIILEMEETLVEVRAAAARTIADQKEIRRHIGKLVNLEANWEEKAELAMSKGREDLAKAALIERQKASDTVDRLRAEVAVLDDGLRAAEEDITNLQTKLRDARSRQNAIQQRITTANTRIRAREAWSGERAQDAFSRFEVLERRADFAEGCADAMKLGMPAKTLEEELADVHADDKIEAAMAALRARTQPKES